MKLKYAFIFSALILSISANQLFAKKSKFENLDLFSKVLDLIENHYYRKVDMGKLIEGAIRGMLETLDPHTAYLDKDAMAKMKADTSGKFGGLGIEVTQKDGVIYVITPIDDTPAYRAGIKAGDKIVEIEHEPVVGLNIGEAIDKMRGEPGSKVNVGIIRKGEDKIINMSLEREIIKLKPVKSEIVKDNYVYIRLTQFQADSADYMVKHLKRHYKSLDNKVNGIVFDLRSNPGGLLDEAVNVSSIFLKEGVVVSTEGRNPKQKEVRFVKNSGYKLTEVPVVVLINGASASASEIVAGALQDHSRALIMGSKSFGKGSVQTILDLTSTQGVKLTIQQYMTPSGKKIQARGIEPDVELAELEDDWMEEAVKDVRYIREVDLRNHLNATIETPEEKKARLAREKQERISRRKTAKAKAKAAKKNENDLPQSQSPGEDYQVLQAINYLKTIAFLDKKK